MITRDAIETKYIGATETKPARIRAMTRWGSLFYPYDDGMSVEQNCTASAMKYAAKKQWSGSLVTGATTAGYVHVLVEQDEVVQDYTEIGPL
jgi:hypothetical protein